MPSDGLSSVLISTPPNERCPLLKELFREQIAPEEIDALVEAPVDQLATTQVRQLLIRREQIKRDRDEIEWTKKAVVDSYDARVEVCDSEQSRIDARLLDYVKLYGKTAFPDVATAYLQEVKPKIDVGDLDKAKKWALDHGYKKDPEPDITACKNSFAEGEIPPEASGFTLVPGGKAFRVRSNG